MTSTPLAELNDRSREVFRRVVEGYLETGDPVGSRTLSRQLSESLSAATIRNVMQDLEHLGLLDSPHTSAGRLPTHLGLRLFVDGLMEVGDIKRSERSEIESSMSSADEDISDTLDRAGEVLSGLTHTASIVLSPKKEATTIKHVEFVSLSADQALAVLVTTDGHVENRLFSPPAGMTPSAMRASANFMNAVLEGRSLSEMRRVVKEEIAQRKLELDQVSQDLIERGMAEWVSFGGDAARLIVRGRSQLLSEGTSEEDLERVRQLFDDLEKKEDVVQLLNLAEFAEGVRIFIGSENKLFSLSGSSLVVSPYMDAERKIIGAVGVIGPTRLNYGRIVPIVDFTARLVGKMISGR